MHLAKCDYSLLHVDLNLAERYKVVDRLLRVDLELCPRQGWA